MALYTVYMRGDGLDAARHAVFVREGFSKGAFVFGVLWLLRHRLWLAAVGWLVAAVAITAATSLLTASAGFGLFLLLAILTGLEAPTWRRRALARAGFATRDVVAAEDRDAAECRFFERLGPSVPSPASKGTPITSGPLRGPAVLGLFPEPKGHP